ncbi:MAG: [acyl-carrier-protein] S-malonyltransferase [Chitinophagia bacterium]|nr:[acyl-carrier-protein] S-malonyltransferase [Chitinophagia bacterium]
MQQVYLFPGQGAQFTGMGKKLYDSHPIAQALMEQANNLLGFRITDVMFNGTEAELKQTAITQPAIYIHSLACYEAHKTTLPAPAMAAGHSLGELSALTAAGVFSFEDGLRLVAARANAMQAACEQNPSGMAVVMGMDDDKVIAIISEIKHEVVVAANYNCPGQLVISGSNAGIALACEQLKAAGAKRAMPLPVGGAFHSPLMEPAKQALATAIDAITFNNAAFPVYQNVDANGHTDANLLKANLKAQMTSSVKWTQTIQNMVANGATHFTELGPGSVLQGLVKKIYKEAITVGYE